MSLIFYDCYLHCVVQSINSLCNMSFKSFCSAEESDCLTEYEEDGMDTVREEEGEEEEDEAEDPEDHSPGEWGQNGIFQTVSANKIRAKYTYSASTENMGIGSSQIANQIHFD